MDYCVTIIVQRLDASLLTAPAQIETAWGTAIRAREVDHYKWKSVVVSLYPPPKHVLDLIPSTWKKDKWYFLTIKNFQWEASRLTEQVRREILEFISLLLPASERWCVCIEKDCDQVNGISQLGRKELLESIGGLFTGKGVAVEGVFYYNRIS